MLSIGAYCFLWPEAPLEDAFFDRLPDRTRFGYGLAAMFGGSGILFSFEAVGSGDRFRELAHLGRMVGGLLTAGGFIYVFWTIFRT